MPLLSGLSTGVKQGSRLSAKAISIGLVSCEDRSIVRQPLHPMRRADASKAALDALDHHVADHLAGDARGRRQPADHLAVVTVESEGYTDDLAVPAGELQRVGAPADIRADRDHPAVMLARGPAAGVALKEQPMLLHQAIDPLRVDRVLAGGSPLALEERGDPPVAIGRPPADYRSLVEAQEDA